MRKKSLLVLVPAVAIVIFGFVFIPKVGSETQTETEKAIIFLKSQSQDPWISMALSGAGETDVALSHLQSVPESQKSATTYAKYILALTANGKNPANFGDENYVEKLKSYFNNSQFGDPTLLNDDIWAILALGSLGQENLGQAQEAKDFILAGQNADGGWGYNVGGTSDTNDTASAAMALIEAGVSSSDPEIQKAAAYLKTAQNDNGGFGYAIGETSDSCSTAWVISAVYKSGQNPLSANWLKNGKSPKDFLLSLQDANGGFWWQAQGDNQFCSAFSALALLGEAYPVETNLALHHIRIEGASENICDVDVFGATAMDSVTSASKQCGFAYTISEYPGMGLYLSQLKGESSWLYLVNSLSPQTGADSYYLEQGDEVLWHSGEWLDKGWFPTKLKIDQSDSLIAIQVLAFGQQATSSAWQNLEIAGLKVKVGSSEFLTDSHGKVEISADILADGFYEMFADTQIIDGKGYIRSPKENLKIGEAPTGHQVGLKANLEQLTAPEKGKQSSISFSVSPDVLDFGSLKPGENAIANLNVANGQADIYLEAEVSGGSVFWENLAIGGKLVPDFSIELLASCNKALPVKLAVPQSYNGSFGAVEGGLTFWAIKK